MERRRRWLVRGSSAVGLVLCVTSCGDGVTVPAATVFEPAARFTLRGEAEGTAASLAIRCAMDLAFTWDGSERLETGGPVYVTMGGGEVVREIEQEDGTGLSIAPLLFSPENHIRLLPGDRVELSTPANIGTGVPFYESIGLMSGRVTGRSSAEGSWTCAPFGSPQDSVGAVQGTWRLGPGV